MNNTPIRQLIDTNIFVEYSSLFNVLDGNKATKNHLSREVVEDLALACASLDDLSYLPVKSRIILGLIFRDPAWADVFEQEYRESVTLFSALDTGSESIQTLLGGKDVYLSFHETVMKSDNILLSELDSLASK